MEPLSFNLIAPDGSSVVIRRSEPYSLDLIAPDGTYVATGSVDLDETNDLFTGWIGLDDTPAAIRSVFEEFEEIVEGQILARIDEAGAKVKALSLRVIFDDRAAQIGRPYVSPTTPASVRAVFEGEAAHPVNDLQVFPSLESVSFRLAATERATLRSTIGAPAASQE